VPESENSNKLDLAVGIAVVLLATFLGLCSVKAGNIGQKIAARQAKVTSNWAWYQARNIRADVYGLARDTEKQAAQEKKMAELKEQTEAVEKEIEQLNALDDQFDLCEAGLAVGLALFGVTALLKRWAMFAVALVPAAVGVFMGVAGFCGMSTDHPVTKAVLEVLG
jgi:hypothetical protein